ncbi:MAG: twin-arginine translocation signal domain-containing protein, partial [Verrucomicrobiota bacterium]
MQAMNRRQFIQRASMAGLTVAGASAFGPNLFAAEGARKTYPKGKAEHCIMIWLGGG